MRISIRRIGGWVMALLLSVASLAASDLRLVEAVQKGDKEAVRSLLEQQADVNAAQADGATALAWAVHRDDLETAELLIRAGANVNAANEYGVAPLWLACSNGNAVMVGKLLKAGANPNAAILTGETVLMTCSRQGNLDAVKSLLAPGADVNAKDSERGQTALMRAVAAKHPEVARALTEAGADVHAYSKGGFTPLLFAAQQGDLDSARILLAAGADVNQPQLLVETARAPRGANAPKEPERPEFRPTVAIEPKGPEPRDFRPTVAATPEGPAGSMTPLLMASASGYEALAIFLLEKGANPNAVDTSGAATLHYALQKGVSSINGTLANPGSRSYDFLFRPNRVELVKALLARGANPNVRISKYAIKNTDRMNLLGATPFLMAAAAGDASVMRLLVAGGADPLLKTYDNTTPLMVAAGFARTRDRAPEEESHALEAVKVAVELGNDVNAANNYGMTALHGAALVGANAIIAYLVENKGANVNAMSNVGQVPLSIASGVYPINIPANEIRFALNAVHKSTVDLLLKLGATPLNPKDFSLPGEDGVPRLQQAP